MSAYAAPRPAIGPDGTIYFSGFSGGVGRTVALNPDFTLKWSYSYGICCGSMTIGRNGMVYITGGQIHAVSAEGQLLWIFRPSDYGDTATICESPAVGTGSPGPVCRFA